MKNFISEDKALCCANVIKRFCSQREYSEDCDTCGDCPVSDCCSGISADNWIIKKSKDDSIYDYDQGIYDCWDLIRNIRKMKVDDYVDAFGNDCDTLALILKNDPMIIKDKYNAWIESKTFYPGDVVIVENSTVSSGLIGVITGAYNDYYAYILYADGSVSEHELKDVKKTGRKIDISTLLSKIQED